MAGFQTRMGEQVTKRERIIGRKLTKSEIAYATHLSYPTIHKWYCGEIIQQIDAETVQSLMDYFQCSEGDLFRVVREGEPLP